MKELQSSRTVRLIVLITVLLVAANVLLGFVLAAQSKSSMKTLIDNRMLDIANTAADMLNGDDLKSLKKEDKGTPKYQKINDTLAFFQKNIDLKYIYCIQNLGNKTFAFSVDPTLEDPGEFGSPIVYTEALYKASLGTAAADDEPYSDAWGRFYSAYSPVFDSNGKVAGIVAVDFGADWYDEQVARQTRSIAVCVAASILMCTLLGYLVVTKTHQLEAALQSAERMRVSRDGYKLESETDKLTGLLNKATTERLVKETLKNNPPGNLSALFIMDLDHFKEMNDAHGHDYGDEVLRSFAKALCHEFRLTDIVGRFGGDEFFALLSDLPNRDIAERKAMQIMQDTLAMQVGGKAVGLSVSIGVALAPEHGTTYEELFHNADQALYWVKNHGRNGYNVGPGETVANQKK